jgi:hypothetical protein
MALCHSCPRPPCRTYATIDGLIPSLHARTTPPIRQNRRINQIITISVPPHTPKWMYLYHSCTPTPCHPYANMGGPIRTSLPPCHPYPKMYGPVRFLDASAMLPIRQNGWRYTVLAREHHANHTPKWTDQSEHHYLHVTPCALMNGLLTFLHATAMPPIRENGWPNQKMTTSMPPYAKMYGPMPFFHATTMPPIRQNVRTNQKVTTFMPSIPQNGCTYTILARDRHATHTPKCTGQSDDHSLHASHTLKYIDLYHSCTRPSCHQYAQLDEPIRTSLPACHPYVKMDL